ncbi:hypothetical protein [Thalassobacillus sp. CUG 92003]|uniref:hypothetical protein n=1 Tax=Thalassobacillus sp. CUG 92003 TaxID=2736641 RepID=UPI0015E7B773|nr:hypothetical protein [Thalassobacillus sp. CUG 92003]
MQEIFTYFAAMLAGYFLLQLPLGGTFLESFSSAIDVVGIITVAVFAVMLVYKGLLMLLGKG